MSPHAQGAASAAKNAQQARSPGRATMAAEVLDFALAHGLTLPRLALRLGLEARTFHAWRAQARAEDGDPKAPNERLTPSVASLNALRAVVALHVVAPTLGAAIYGGNETYFETLAKVPRPRLVDEPDRSQRRPWQDGDE